MVVGKDDCMTSPKNVCLGGYAFFLWEYCTFELIKCTFYLSLITFFPLKNFLNMKCFRSVVPQIFVSGTGSVLSFSQLLWLNKRIFKLFHKSNWPILLWVGWCNKPLGMLGCRTLEKLLNHFLSSLWFTSFSCVLPTSCVHYCSSKPIERVIHCLINIPGFLQ